MMVLVVVEDHGVGVSSEMKVTLFRPFKQAQRLAGGTGLGLFSLYKRIEALGGNCGCTDRRDGQPGSLFWFTFPYRSDESTSAFMIKQQQSLRASTKSNGDEVYDKSGDTCRSLIDEQANNISVVDRTQSVDHEVSNRTVDTEHDEVKLMMQKQHALRGGGNFQGAQGLVQGDHRMEERIGQAFPRSTDSCVEDTFGKKVLLIDDTPMILKVVSRLLKANGHSVDTAVNGLQGFEKLKQGYLNSSSPSQTEGGGGGGGYEFVLTDLQMPVMDGK